MQQEPDTTRPVLSGPDAEQGLPLGPPLRVFRARALVRLVVALSGFTIAAGGIALILYDVTQGIFVYSAGWFPLPLGLAALVLAYLMGRSSYLIGPDGVVKVRLGHRQICRWDEVGAIVDRHEKQGVVTTRICVLMKKEGNHLELQDLGIDDFAGMVNLIRQKAASLGIPFKEERVTK